MTIGSRARARSVKPLLQQAVLVFLAFSSVAGCALHRTDEAPAPLSGGQGVPLRDPTLSQATQPPWWTAWDDQALDRLVREALAKNFDAAATRERIAQARASARRSSAARLPWIDASARIEEEVYNGDQDDRDTRWQFGAGLTWDLDVFGRLKSMRLSREAEVWARVHEAEQFQLSLSADVAEAYFGIKEQRHLLLLLDDQMKTARELEHIIEQRFKEGLISRLDVLQQRTQIAELEAQIPAARASLEDLQNALGALLGDLPQGMNVLASKVESTLPDVPAMSTLPQAGDLLRRRPDLRALQAILVSADADVGRAMADRLPRLTLWSDALKTEQGDGVISIGADLVQPLLDWGSRRAEWERSKSYYRERLNLYSQAYLRAVWQVQALVSNEARQRELLASLHVRRDLLEQTIKQARGRYDAGLTDYLPVLSATQQLYAVEQRLIREKRRLVSLRTSLYRALGGPTLPLHGSS